MVQFRCRVAGRVFGWVGSGFGGGRIEFGCGEGERDGADACGFDSGGRRDGGGEVREDVAFEGFEGGL